MAAREETIVPVLVASPGANSSSGGPRGLAICRRDEVFYSRWCPGLQNRNATRVPNAIKISATAMFINIFGHFRNSERVLPYLSSRGTRGVVTGRGPQPHANFRPPRRRRGELLYADLVPG